MENSEERPRVRVVKARNQAKSGTIQVQDQDGKTFYKVPCDRCDAVVRLPFQPYKDREVTCKECRFVATKGKPSTRVKRKAGKISYLTECDLCGDIQQTPFLPKKDRRFLCDGCYQAEKEAAGDEPKAEDRSVSAESGKSPVEAKSPSRADTRSVSPDPAAPPREEPRFNVTCRRCKKVQQLRFKPNRGEYFMCKDCFIKDREREELRKGKPDTRLMFQIECVDCGKVETVNFIPKDIAEPMCTACFEKRKKRR
ncbi:MAG: hypothetical protein QNK37_11885 [Acidobacteriota bacterium]|nr:hypothetical protein [Acidobacteriota bacterium]